LSFSAEIAFSETTPPLNVISLSHLSLILDFSKYLDVAFSWRISMPREALAVVSHIGPTPGAGAMAAPHALSALAALGQPTRLSIFRLLMQREPDGMPAGTLAEEIGCPPNTLSSHLAILARAGLVRGERNGRSITYRAEVDGMRALMAFLVTDCCSGRPELCDFAAKQAAACCPPAPRTRKRRR
jgi:ArsR family transcriptional regulator